MVDSFRGDRRVGGGFKLQGLGTGVVYRTVVAEFGVIVSQLFRALILWQACCRFSCFWPSQPSIPRPIADSGVVPGIIVELSQSGQTAGSGRAGFMVTPRSGIKISRGLEGLLVTVVARLT